MAREGTGSCSGRSGSDLSNESDLDDIPLFHPSLMPAPERHAPFRLAMPHAGPMLTASGGSQQEQANAKAEDQANTPRNSRDPSKLSLNLGHLAPAHAGPQQSTQLSFALPTASLQRPNPLLQRGSTSLATPDPAMEPLPTSRTSGVRSPVTTLQLPMRSSKQAPQSKVPALPIGTSSTEDLLPSRQELVSGQSTVPALRQPALPRLTLNANTPLPPDSQHGRLAAHRMQEHSSTGSIHSTHSSPCLSPSGNEAYSSPEDDTLLAGSDDIAVDQHSPHSNMVIEACLLSQPFCRVLVNGPEHSNQAAKDSQCKSVVSDAVRQRVLQQCGDALDIELHHLDLYQVSPLPGTQQGTQKMAVNISTNSFSLAALEQLLTRNKQLEALQQQNLEVINSMRKDHTDLAQRHMELQHTHSQLLVRATQQDCALKASDYKQEQLEQEVKLLREKLREADDHRHQLRDVIEKLSKEMHSTLRLHVQQQQPLQQ